MQMESYEHYIEWLALLVKYILVTLCTLQAHQNMLTCSLLELN